MTEINRRGPGPLEAMPRRLRRRRPPAAHDQHRDGRSRRCRARISDTTASNLYRRLVRHARGAGLPPSSRRMHVRSMILDGVAPMDMRLPLFTARDAQRALDKLLTDCDADSACKQAFPELATPNPEPAAAPRAASADRPDRASAHRHPPKTCASRRASWPSILFSALYSPLTASIVPRAGRSRRAQRVSERLRARPRRRRRRREHERRHAALGAVQRRRRRVVTQTIVRAGNAGTLFGPHLLSSQLEACAMWPQGAVDRVAITSRWYPDVPALGAVGRSRSRSRRRRGASRSSEITRARHATSPRLGTRPWRDHARRAASSSMQDFIDRASSDVARRVVRASVKRPPFFVTPAGPDPAACRRPRP